MGLDLLPRRTTHHDTTNELPEGMTHLEGTPCPFADDDFPIGPISTCCSLRGKVAAENLDALGEDDLCRLLYEDMDVVDALCFATTLRKTADRLEQRYAGQTEKPTGAYYGGKIELTTGEFTPWPKPSFEEVIASIRKAADWYEKVARLGFGVHAWF